MESLSDGQRAVYSGAGVTVFDASGRVVANGYQSLNEALIELVHRRALKDRYGEVYVQAIPIREMTEELMLLIERLDIDSKGIAAAFVKGDRSLLEAKILADEGLRVYLIKNGAIEETDDLVSAIVNDISVFGQFSQINTLLKQYRQQPETNALEVVMKPAAEALSDEAENAAKNLEKNCGTGQSIIRTAYAADLSAGSGQVRAGGIGCAISGFVSPKLHQFASWMGTRGHLMPIREFAVLAIIPPLHFSFPDIDWTAGLHSMTSVIDPITMTTVADFVVHNDQLVARVITGVFFLSDLLHLPGDILTSFLWRSVTHTTLFSETTLAQLEGKGYTLVKAEDMSVVTLQGKKELPVYEATTKQGKVLRFVPVRRLWNVLDQWSGVDLPLDLVIAPVTDAVISPLTPVGHLMLRAATSKTMAFLIINGLAQAAGNALGGQISPWLVAPAAVAQSAASNVISTIIQIPIRVGYVTYRVGRFAIGVAQGRLTANSLTITQAREVITDLFNAIQNIFKKGQAVIQKANDDGCFSYNPLISRVYAAGGSTGVTCSLFWQRPINSFKRVYESRNILGSTARFVGRILVGGGKGAKDPDKMRPIFWYLSFLTIRDALQACVEASSSYKFVQDWERILSSIILHRWIGDINNLALQDAKAHSPLGKLPERNPSYRSMQSIINEGITLYRKGASLPVVWSYHPEYLSTVDVARAFNMPIEKDSDMYNQWKPDCSPEIEAYVNKPIYEFIFSMKDDFFSPSESTTICLFVVGAYTLDNFTYREGLESLWAAGGYGPSLHEDIFRDSWEHVNGDYPMLTKQIEAKVKADNNPVSASYILSYFLDKHGGDVDLAILETADYLKFQARTQLALWENTEITLWQSANWMKANIKDEYSQYLPYTDLPPYSAGSIMDESGRPQDYLYPEDGLLTDSNYRDAKYQDYSLVNRVGGPYHAFNMVALLHSTSPEVIAMAMLGQGRNQYGLFRWADDLRILTQLPGLEKRFDMVSDGEKKYPACTEDKRLVQ